MRAIGIVLAGGNSKRMRELSNKRAVAAMPVAGSYRSIDFALSNMTNSHIQNVAVFTQYNSRSPEPAFKFLQVVGFRTQTGRIIRIHAIYHTGERGLVPWNGRCPLSEPDILKEQP